MKHLSGNLRSRFSDFLTSDGEKPDRNRDAEFEMASPVSRDDIIADWNRGWTIVMESVAALRPEDLTRTIYIRHEAFVMVEALNRSITHAAYHVGQIVMLAKHLAGPAWKSLSIPKGPVRRPHTGQFKTRN